MNQENSNIKNQYRLSFAALDRVVEQNIIKPTEVVSGRGFVTWGEKNNYPFYLEDLYNNVCTLKTIIDGLTDYVCGSSISMSSWETVNSKGETLGELVHKCALDYLIFGGFSLNVLRNKLGQIAELHYLDFRLLRTNEEHTEFMFTRDWNKSYGRVKYTVYPAFRPDGNEPSSVFWWSNTYKRVYPTPMYGAALLSCEMEKSINEFHLNSLKNGFTGSYIVNFNSGVPDDAQKEEIEDAFYEKFCGYANGSRPMISFNDTKENEVTVNKISGDDFADRYTELVKRSRQEIFTAFRATPNLFGLPTETTGFNAQEYMESFKLFNKTVVYPIQLTLKTVFERLLGHEMVIEPFEIDFE